MGEVEWKKLGILGKGSYGTVFKIVITAPEVIKGRLFALKSSKGQYIDCLKEEGNILRSFCGCKEIVQCVGSEMRIEDGESVCNLIMEFSPYGSLGDLIKKRALSECEVKTYARMLLKGLSLIHQHGVVHCDLKPDNIFLFPSTPSDDGMEYKLKIADFGVSKTINESFDANIWRFRFRGSPRYMSPESVMGEIDTPLDIWSFGCIMIEMITGSYVWNNVSTSQDMMVILAYRKEAPQIPSFLNLDCQDFLTKCFIKDPNKRWTATMLLNHPFLMARTSTRVNSLLMSPFSFFSYDCFLPYH